MLSSTCFGFLPLHHTTTQHKQHNNMQTHHTDILCWEALLHLGCHCHVTVCGKHLNTPQNLLFLQLSPPFHPCSTFVCACVCVFLCECVSVCVCVCWNGVVVLTD